MKIIKYIIISLFVVTVGISCQLNEKVESQNKQETAVEAIAKNISVTEFQSLIGENAIVLDVRTTNEFNAGHIENAVNIDFYSADFINEVVKLDKSKTLLIHCASGGRSAKAMKNLSGKGFNTMYNMLGGFGAWKQNNLPFIK